MTSFLSDEARAYLMIFDLYTHNGSEWQEWKRIACNDLLNSSGVKPRNNQRPDLLKYGGDPLKELLNDLIDFG